MSLLIDAIRDGMAKEHEDPAMAQLGELLTDWVTRNHAGERDVGNKTLSGAMGAMRTEAQKRQKGGCGCVSDAEGLKIALGYFDITGEGTASAPARPAADDALDLDTLLGKL